jgi:hypothetical protein
MTVRKHVTITGIQTMFFPDTNIQLSSTKVKRARRISRNCLRRLDWREISGQTLSWRELAVGGRCWDDFGRQDAMDRGKNNFGVW